jgi:hypothetical protein
MSDARNVFWRSPPGTLHLRRGCRANSQPRDSVRITLDAPQAREVLRADQVCPCARHAVQVLWLKRGVRFQAFPTQTVQDGDGSHVVPVYRVTQVREETIYYRIDDDGINGMWITTLDQLESNGLEILQDRP